MMSSFWNKFGPRVQGLKGDIGCVLQSNNNGVKSHEVIYVVELYSGGNYGTLERLFPIHRCDIDGGFKYLGFYLKPNTYK